MTALVFRDEVDHRVAIRSTTLGNERSYYFGAAYKDYNLQNPPEKIAYYTKLMRAAVADVARPRVLDVGCAFGRMLRDLPDTWERCGVDASEYALGVAREDVPGATFLHCELPPQGLGTFDLITAFDVIEHVEDFEPMIERVDELLAPGGTFVFVVPVYDGPLGALVRLLDFDATHVNKWSRKAWVDEATRRFDAIEWHGIYRYLFPGKFVHIPTRLFRDSAPAILVTAKKRG